MKRFQVKYGRFPGEKGYVVVDMEEGNTTKEGRRILFSSHGRSLAEAQADRLNEEASRSLSDQAR